VNASEVIFSASSFSSLIGLTNSKEIEYDIATATTYEEIKQLGKAGFDKYDEANGKYYFRRIPKNVRCYSRMSVAKPLKLPDSTCNLRSERSDFGGET
jgi:hypothetical protein